MNEIIIELNVGGTFYTTYKSTLTKYPNSMLASMFSGRHPISTINGRYFLDCDGEIFINILNYLRRDQFILPTSTDYQKRLFLECSFLGIPIPLCSNSIILDNDTELISLLNSLLPNFEDSKLIYRASTQGWLGADFHHSVDNFKNTLLLVQVGSSIFGGFSPYCWNGGYLAAHSDCFLFSLRNPSRMHEGIKLANVGQHSIHGNNNTYGASFGTFGSFDLAISANAKSIVSTTRLGNCFSHPSHDYRANSKESNSFFCGSEAFIPKEIEVFALQ